MTDRATPLQPLALLGGGLLLVLLDLRINGLDVVPDPLGWLLALAAAASLSRLHDAFRVAAAACGVGFLASVPQWVGSGGGLVEVATGVAETVLVFFVCTAIMVLVPERRRGANAIRWWDLGLTIALTLLVVAASGEPDLAVVALLVGLTDLGVVICFVVLLFRAAKATPAGPGKTIRIRP